MVTKQYTPLTYFFQVNIGVPLQYGHQCRCRAWIWFVQFDTMRQALQY